MFLQICFPNIFTQVGILTVQFLEDRFFFLKKYIIAIKSEETGLNRQLKDAVSLATKILKYPLNSKTLQKKKEKASTVFTFSCLLYAEAFLCNYGHSYRQIKCSLKWTLSPNNFPYLYFQSGL